MKHPVLFKKWVAPILLCALLTGCATAPVKLNTPSGRPEVTIFGSTKKKISNTIINRELSKGWDLKSQADSLLVFTRKNTELGTQLLFGSRYDSVPESRITFTLVEIEDAIRVLLKGEIVTNPGSTFERIEDVTAINAAEAEALQIALEEIKTGIEATNNRDGVVSR
ncbi:MAG: hypothetical protein GX445_07565 [Elusimicrobia bacterium]|jgi:hypothetical protein|nr:hypothetical protein [Elusimicrobiota bacterium]